MKYKFIDENITYDGSQLRSLFGYLEHQVLGDSVISWIGPCDIARDKIVDGEDLLADASICGSNMLHFIIEKFQISLFAGVCLQRLMASILVDLLLESAAVEKHQISRQGDDLYIGAGKLNISIATQSPTSTLIHFAVNIDNEGTPVQTACLSDYQIDAVKLSHQLAQKFIAEVESMQKATMKVRWVN